MKSSPLVVVHDTRERALALGNALDQGLGAGRRSGLSRRYAAEGMSVAKWREQRRRSRESQRAARHQPDRRPAGRSRRRRARRRDAARLPGAGITAIRGGEATRARLLAEFRSGDYDAIHFAGHAFFDAAAPAVERHPVRRRARAVGRPISRRWTPCRHSCSSMPANPVACARGQPAAAARPQRRLRRGIPARRRREFHRHLVAGIRRRAPSAFATTLYRDLAKGESIGERIEFRRASVRALPSADWANYLHYGSYDFTLKAPKA